MTATSLDLSQIKTDALSSAATFRTLIGLGSSDAVTFAGLTTSGDLTLGSVCKIKNPLSTVGVLHSDGVDTLAWTNQQIRVSNSVPVGWSAGYGTTLNTAMSRVSDGVVEVNNGTPVASGGTLGTLQAASIANQSGNVDLASNSVVGLRVNNAVTTVMPGSASPRLDMGSSGFRIVRSGNSGQIILSNAGNHLKLMASDGLIARNQTDTADAPISAGAITASGAIGVFGATPPASQPAAIADATDLASALTSLNSLLAAARSYGLIAS